jgi:hypothetical protein
VIDLDTGVLLSYPERAVTVPLPGTKFTVTRVPETVMPSLPDRYGLRLWHDLMGISVACKWFLFFCFVVYIKIDFIVIFLWFLFCCVFCRLLIYICEHCFLRAFSLAPGPFVFFFFF